MCSVRECGREKNARKLAKALPRPLLLRLVVALSLGPGALFASRLLNYWSI